MPTTQEKQRAREWALREIISLIGMPQRGGNLTFGHSSNPYANDREKALVDREIDRIRWQLEARHQKVSRSLGM